MGKLEVANWILELARTGKNVYTVADSGQPTDFISAISPLISQISPVGGFATQTVANVYTAADSGEATDWISAISRTGGFAGEMVANRMQKTGTDAAKEAYESLADIISWTLVVIGALELALLGWGNPEQGNTIKAAGDEYKHADENLEDALPGKVKWRGEAADAYAQQVADQRLRVKAIQECDTKLVGILATEAEQLKGLRLGFTITQDSLAVCIPIALALLLSPPTPNKLASNAFQIGVCFAATIYLTSHMSMMMSHSTQNARRVEELTAQYNDLAAQAANAMHPVLSGAPPAPLPQVRESTVSSFDTIPESMSGMPDFATLARSGMARAGASLKQQAPMTALTDSTEGAGAGAERPADTPAWTPSLSQTGKAPWQLAPMSGQASQLMNQMMGQVQRLSMGQQGEAAAPPARAAEKVAAEGAAPGEATLAGDERAPVELGAAGPEGARRAPIDVTPVGAQQAQEPNPVERSG